MRDDEVLAALSRLQAELGALIAHMDGSPKCLEPGQVDGMLQEQQIQLALLERIESKLDAISVTFRGSST